MGGGEFRKPWDPRAQEILLSLRTLINAAERLWTCPHVGAAMAQALVVNVVIEGLFEEEEEGTGVASDEFKVEGEDPATPGPLI